MNTSHANSNNGGRLARLAVLLVLVYYLPPFLLWLGIIPFAFRFHTLVILTIVMAGYAFASNYRLNDLGFRKDTLKESLFWNGGLSLLFVAIMYVAYKAGWIRKPTVPDWNLFFIFYVFISSPSQEFLYRSILFAEMQRANITYPICQVLISSITYCFLHIFYNDPLTLGVTLFMGIIWGLIYYKYPNFWGVALSHAVLGVVSILVGII